MDLLATRDRWWMSECEAVLQAESIEAQWRDADETEAGAREIVLLEVSATDGERASAVLSEQLGEELRRRQIRSGTPRWIPLPLQPAFAAALCASLLLLFFYAMTGGATDDSDAYRRGIMLSPAFARGEWWRIVTAATLHADLEHVLSNVGFLIVLGWAANERFGVGVSLALWLVTAIVGFAASYYLSDAVRTVGASGGLFGLLGASGGHGLRQHGSEAEFSFRDKLRNGGAAVLLLAFTAFSPEANIHAHVGGFVVGFALGCVLPRERPLGSVVQVTAFVASFALLLTAWRASGATIA